MNICGNGPLGDFWIFVILIPHFEKHGDLGPMYVLGMRYVYTIQLVLSHRTSPGPDKAHRQALPEASREYAEMVP